MKSFTGIIEWRTIVKKIPQQEQAHKDDFAWIFNMLGWKKDARKRN